MTDRLLEHKKTGEPGVYALYAGSESEADWEAALTRTGQAMSDKNRAVLGDADDIAAADRFVGERIEGARRGHIDLRRRCTVGHFKLPENQMTVRELPSGLGEANSAHRPMLRQRRPGNTAVSIK